MLLNACSTRVVPCDASDVRSPLEQPLNYPCSDQHVVVLLCSKSISSIFTECFKFVTYCILLNNYYQLLLLVRCCGFAIIFAVQCTCMI